MQLELIRLESGIFNFPGELLISETKSHL